MLRQDQHSLTNLDSNHDFGTIVGYSGTRVDVVALLISHGIFSDAGCVSYFQAAMEGLDDQSYKPAVHLDFFVRKD